MATLRAIKRRIASVKSTQQITKAMKMVAAAKLRKAQFRLLSARPYSYKLKEVIGQVAMRTRKKVHPLLQVREAKQECFVLVTADRGLCGSFNSNLIRRVTFEMKQSNAHKIDLFVIGRKGYDFFRRRQIPMEKHYIDFLGHLDFSHAQKIAGDLIRGYLHKKYDRIWIVYNEFKSAIQQRILVEQFLPILSEGMQTQALMTGFLFEPSAERVLDQLLPMYLNFQMWRILLESAASEHGARMTAMETATDNADDMIKELVLYYNKARQAAITKELNEIVGGAEALKG